MENFPSPGASCGSPFSDVTSGSPGQYSDTFEPVSPDYNLDTLRADFSAAVQSASPSDMAVEDNDEDNQAVLADYRFYQHLEVGSPGATQSHVQYLMTKYKTGRMALPTKNSSARPNSLTPYSDYAKSKKPGKEGAIKRPLNNFMCFSKIERGQLMAGQPELHNARISEHLGEVWKLCPTELKDLYREMAQWLKELHRQEHPEYKYRPRKRKTPSGGAGSAAASGPGAAATGTAEGPKASKRVRKPPAKPRSRSRKNTGQAHVVPVSNLSDVPSTPESNEQLYSDVPQQCYILDIKPSLGELQRFSADVNSSLGELQRVSADVKPLLGELRRLNTDSNPALYAIWPERSEPDLASAGSLTERGSSEVGMEDDMVSREEPKNGGGLEDLEAFEPLQLPPLASLDDLNLCDQYGFEVGSEDLVEGPQLHDALEYEGDLQWNELFGGGVLGGLPGTA